jgi:hypothetical protein
LSKQCNICVKDKQKYRTFLKQYNKYNYESGENNLLGLFVPKNRKTVVKNKEEK